MAHRLVPALAAGLLSAALGACVSDASPTPSSSAAPTPTATGAPTATATTAATPSGSPSPSEPPSPNATPEPTLSLEPPDGRDEREVAVEVGVDVPADADGRIVVTVTSRADSMIEELVLRWPEALHATLFPAPFVPSEDRIREGGAPLVQPWTKWVVGPGERGEPAGTVSLGYGPLPAGGTLEIPLFVTRRAAGSVSFDLQLLAGEELLTAEGGAPAEVRVEVP